MKKLLFVFSLFLSVGAFAQNADSVKKDGKVNPGIANSSLPPLVMVDGVKYKGDIKALNAQDIKSVDVLKAGPSTDKYGVEGVNGVILITTKKGKANSLTSAPIITASDSVKVSPLYIIDGNKATAEDLKKINRDDIANISVLKDASANSIYGPEGKNGVVIVVTKAYKKQQEARKAEVEKQGKGNQ